MPQAPKCSPSDTGLRRGPVAQRRRCGITVETLAGRAFAGHPARFDSLIWNHQTSLAEAASGDPAKTPSHLHRVHRRLPGATLAFVEAPRGMHRSAAPADRPRSPRVHPLCPARFRWPPRPDSGCAVAPRRVFGSPLDSRNPENRSVTGRAHRIPEAPRALAPRAMAPEESAARLRDLGSLPARRERPASSGRRNAASGVHVRVHEECECRRTPKAGRAAVLGGFR